MWNKCKVVMLPTKEKSKLVLSFKEKSFNQLTEPKLALIEESNYQLSNIQSQHLYILSDEEIKEGDWYVFDVVNKTDNCKKIIATTDKSLTIKGYDTSDEEAIVKLYLPEPPQEFIEHFVTEYNKGNIITEVTVEYEREYIGKKQIGITPAGEPTYINEGYSDWKLKINSDNTINIKPIKTSWSREEVENLLRNFRTDILPFGQVNDFILNKWIEENL